MHTHGYISLILAALLVASSSDTVQLSLAPESHLWLEGTHTLGSYRCNAATLSGAGVMASSSSTSGFVYQAVKAELVVDVTSFDCGNPDINRDLLNALKSDDHREIRFLLKRASVIAVLHNDQEGHLIEVTGEISIAGIRRDITTVFRGRELAEDAFRIYGSKRLYMSDFNIEPPSALLGLIRVNDRLTVNFDLVATAAPTLPRDYPQTVERNAEKTTVPSAAAPRHKQLLAGG